MSGQAFGLAVLRKERMKREILGLALMVLSCALVYVGRPRLGEVTGFLKGSPNLQSAYAIALMCSFLLGIALIIVGYNGR